MSRLYDIVINQGETWQLDFPVLNSKNAPVDATWMTVRGQIRPRPDSATVLYDWRNNAQNVVIEGATVSLQVPADVSSEWTWTTGVYDVEIVDTSTAPPTVTRLLEGRVYVRPETTR